MQVINSLENNKVKLWNKLKQKKYRDQYGLFVIEEKHLINEAKDAGIIDTLIIRENCENCFDMPAVYVNDAVMKKISNNVSLNDYVAICHTLPKKEIKGSSFIILENVQDPGNVGTIIRTAYSLGYDAVLLTKDCASVYGYKTIQSTQGAMFHIPVITDSLENIIAAVKEQGCKVYATTLDSSHFLSETVKTDKYAIMMGNEGQGLSEKAVSLADENIKIEMANFESLNVAIAMGICAYYMKH